MITRRNYRPLCDFAAVRQFMTEIYERDWRNGVPAPFLEYALCCSWMDTSLVHRFSLWEEAGRVVALVFYENPINHAYFSLRPGYERLVGEMIDYAEADMPKVDGRQQLVLFGAQKALVDAAERRGYARVGGYNELVYDFSKPLEHELPQGFSFVPSDGLDYAKLSECCYRGFDNEQTDGPWDGDYEDVVRISLAPNSTLPLCAVVQNERGEYVCCAGMWWTRENGLAYMEPLCTVPEYRRRGLAAAALSELYRRTKPLGATHMTGGGDPFYAKIGFEPCIEWGYYERVKTGGK